MFFTNDFIDLTHLGFPWQSKRYAYDNDNLSKIETKLAAAVLSLCVFWQLTLWSLKFTKLHEKGEAYEARKILFSVLRLEIFTTA